MVVLFNLGWLHAYALRRRRDSFMSRTFITATRISLFLELHVKKKKDSLETLWTLSIFYAFFYLVCIDCLTLV